MGHGVSACATCDGFFFKDKKVVVVGGGDSAMEEATFLTKFASEVTIYRRDQFRASKIMVERALANPKIHIKYNSIIKNTIGEKENGVSSIQIEDVITNKKTIYKCEGVFLAIGHTPNTEIFKNI